MIEDRRETVRRYLAGESAPALAAEAGCAVSTIRRWVTQERAHPGVIPPWGGARPHPPQRDEDLAERIIHLHRRGWSVSQIARTLARHPNTVRRYLRSDGSVRSV